MYRGNWTVLELPEQDEAAAAVRLQARPRTWRWGVDTTVGVSINVKMDRNIRHAVRLRWDSDRFMRASDSS